MKLKFWSSAQLPCLLLKVSEHILLSAETATLEKDSGANFFRIPHYSNFRPNISPDDTLQEAEQAMASHLSDRNDYRHFKSHGNTDARSY